eukprot:CAMPEP_0118957408 /NCGR_PEP_ID=MMETSP1169-20130426/62090_1 /TAXON_ID=36882 /ORGANISM="Pyramimonas obovata, Strain CCMP722" /LENGTH=237 /DNA_ID=CAMNT_0006905489 /DNA_START=422 /DNA_END=1135 /DNA_ORIENTATION=+
MVACGFVFVQAIAALAVAALTVSKGSGGGGGSGDDNSGGATNTKQLSSQLVARVVEFKHKGRTMSAVMQAGMMSRCKGFATVSSRPRHVPSASVVPSHKRAFQGGAGARQAILCTRVCRRSRNKFQVTRAQKEDGENVALSVVKTAVNAAAGLVPDSVPRPVAKGGVVAVLAGTSFLALKAVLSTFISLLAIAALAVAALTVSKGSGGGGGSGDDNSGGEGGDDALEEARRIMDKYK